jgi:hypothetical protein
VGRPPMHATPASPALLPTRGNSLPLPLCAVVHLQVHVAPTDVAAMHSACAPH